MRFGLGEWTYASSISKQSRNVVEAGGEQEQKILANVAAGASILGNGVLLRSDGPERRWEDHRKGGI